MLRIFKTMAAIMPTALVMAGCSTVGGYEPPRMADGTPDLQGVWTNVSLTSLERPERYESLAVDEERAQRIEETAKAQAEQGLEPTDPEDPAPEAGQSVGGYNSFWTDSGSSLAKIDGEYRTSWLVDPEDGQLPYSEEGRERFRREMQETRNGFEGPEVRSVAERCMVGFGSSGGPPMMNVMYNNNYRIVQNEDYVMIMVEMNHDARVVRLQDEHQPESMRRWLGDSVGRWDGDTLVIETRNFHPQERLRLYFDRSFYISENAVITERLTRVAEDKLHYEFEVDDPEIYTQTWRGEMAFNATEGPIFEYACHEGNVALPGILAGARAEEEEEEQE